MNALRASLALFALAGCATPPTAGVMPYVVETALVDQPDAVPVYNNASPPRGTVGVTLWGPVEKLPAPPTDATSSNGVLDIVIDSASIPGNVAARNGLGTIVMGFSFSTPVQAGWYYQSYQLRVPRAEGVAQVVAYFNLRDRVNGTHIWFGHIAFDSRCGIPHGGAMWDQGTNTAIYNVPAANFSCRTFGDWRPMSFAVGPEQILMAATALRARFRDLKLSGDPDDYELTHANVNPEVVARGSETARIDVGITRWQLSTHP